MDKYQLEREKYLFSVLIKDIVEIYIVCKMLERHL